MFISLNPLILQVAPDDSTPNLWTVHNVLKMGAFKFNSTYTILLEDIEEGFIFDVTADSGVKLKIFGRLQNLRRGVL